jgi:hypothetical protein
MTLPGVVGDNNCVDDDNGFENGEPGTSIFNDGNVGVRLCSLIADKVGVVNIKVGTDVGVSVTVGS